MHGAASDDAADARLGHRRLVDDHGFWLGRSEELGDAHRRRLGLGDRHGLEDRRLQDLGLDDHDGQRLGLALVTNRDRKTGHVEAHPAHATMQLRIVVGELRGEADHIHLHSLHF